MPTKAPAASVAELTAVFVAPATTTRLVGEPGEVGHAADFENSRRVPPTVPGTAITYCDRTEDWLMAAQSAAASTAAKVSDDFR